MASTELVTAAAVPAAAVAASGAECLVAVGSSRGRMTCRLARSLRRHNWGSTFGCTRLSDRRCLIVAIIAGCIRTARLRWVWGWGKDKEHLVVGVGVAEGATRMP